MNKMMRLLALVLATSTVLVGCNSSDGAKGKEKGETVQLEAKDPEYIGENLKYDVNSIINNGEKMELSLWTDPETEPFYQEAIDRYTAIHPNISFNVVVQPWSDYWTKLPLALGSGSGPDIYRAHTAAISNLASYTYELPSDIFPQDDLVADYPAIEESMYDGKTYTIPLGTTTGAGVYYNKTMWGEAGLTDADIPTTLDEFIEVGQKLTVKDDKGNVTRYGYSIDHTFEKVLFMLNYIKGEPSFQQDLYTWNLDNETTYENIEMLKDFKDKYGFMMYTDGDSEDQLGHGQAAMIFQETWVGGYLNDAYPDVDWGFFMMPTVDGQEPVAYDKKGYEWTLSVSAQDEAKRAVAFDFLKFYTAEEEVLLSQTIRLSCIPSKVSLLAAPEIEELPHLSQLSNHTDKYVYIGLLPTEEAMNKALRGAGSDIFINNKDTREVIQGVQKQIMDDTAKNKFEYKSIEDKYPEYDKFNK